MANSIIAIIVTYHPNIEDLLASVKTFINEVAEVLIIDNTASIVDWQSLLSYDKINIINNTVNLGVANGLNIGLRYALNKHYDYGLLLDQDSMPQSNFISNLLSGFNVDHKVILTSPQIIDVDNINKYLKSSIQYEYVPFAITSGTLLKLCYLPVVGMFDEALFIDYVDFEFCLRARRYKFKIVRCKDAILKHSLGNMREINLFGIKVYPTNHNSLRQYYKIRNRIYVWRRYFCDNKLFVIKNIVRCLIDIFLIIAFEDNKFDKLRFMSIGVKDAITNNYGCYYSGKQISRP